MTQIMKKTALFAALTLTFALGTSCVEDKIYDGVTISGLQNTVAYTEDDAVTVTANVASLVDIAKVELKYKLGGAAEATAAMSSVSKGVYSGTIPGAAEGTKVTYRVEASTGSRSAVSAEASYTVGEVPIDYSGLVLNELNGNDKFIELYNKGNDEIRIKGVNIIKDDKVEEAVWTAPSAIIKPGEYILLYSEDVQADHPEQSADYIFHSGLSAKKAVKIELRDPKGNRIDVFNLVQCVTKAEASYARVPDGSGSWYHCAATPGKANENNTANPVEGLEK